MSLSVHRLTLSVFGTCPYTPRSMGSSKWNLNPGRHGIRNISVVVHTNWVSSISYVADAPQMATGSS